ncbi:transketolase family protein [Patescibacteria group bacterium]|nr:transketolase family protein [Patescibacteria group bacterium]
MLNKELYLNEDMFENPQMSATRDGYSSGLLNLAKIHNDVVVLTADLTESTRVEEFSKLYKDRFFECGVAEQNMAGVAAGLAVTGKTPYISSYATFSPGRNWEVIRTTIIYNRANVKIAGHHSGLMTAEDGATHQATEDIAILRCIPDITIIVPTDAIEARKATEKSYDIKGPVYLRFTRANTSIMTTDKTPFSVGKNQTFWIGNNPKVSIFATGFILYNALTAAKELQKEGIEVNVVNVSTIKESDTENIIKEASTTRAVVTAEDHQITGGLGGMISEVLSQNMPTPIEFVGMQNTFGESGSPDELLLKYHMDKDSIKEKVRKVIARKK